ncbi:MAG: response regulator transcription factor [Roseofilum sp. SBFL]|uniref:response regulator transcription factor n=1 Tax=unclassified Roseofilum TaxID=2620099 RepID=UPI001B13CBE4|nr:MULTISPECIES: response regulator transcription factor [unclassified Roseofilum]MBP0011758.1 response regulator transcription factor [Roseofilum sp. SID3]MBP0025697.1 response regulator transcription factor [Roseofilum sp. SID2]MBP0038828.1 response regulator transcription factor [Roseofilum sp. SID1]MBP0040381.1 response regulator transcription factor [Roseofilum sp. SBFL]
MSLVILVVEDDLGTRLAIQDYLEQGGYSVILAAHGKEALQQVEQYHPYLIVTDIAMPLMDGYELVRQIRKKPEFRLLPVVFLTARTAMEDRIRGYQLGCDVYLPKPFELEELGAVVRNLIERYSLMMQAMSKAPNLELPSPPEPAFQKVTSSDLALTEREWDVLHLLTSGLSNVQIGQSLHLSPRTIEKYVSSLLRKTLTNNRAELVHYAMQHRLIE